MSLDWLNSKKGCQDSSPNYDHQDNLSHSTPVYQIDWQKLLEDIKLTFDPN